MQPFFSRGGKNHYAPSGNLRLVFWCVGLAPTEKTPIFRRGRTPGLLFIFRCLLVPTPVSYTHLDVYKRQVLDAPLK